ncbi:MAG TPA: DUF222 domain-containing protein, partial [bacterium]|nr:DUF222 domain-containing protein [bacterium]
EAKGWHDQGAISCAHWLTWRVGWDPGTARERVRVARALGTLPRVDAALRSGALSYAKVRALTRVGTPENEEKLLHMALLATGAQLERLCRGYRSVVERQAEVRIQERSIRKVVLPGGMVKLVLVLEPDEADLILRAVDRAREVHTERREAVRDTEARDVSAEARDVSAEARDASAEAKDVSAETSWPSRADGAVTLAESFLAEHAVTGSGGERFQVMVHLDQEALGPDGAWSATLEDGSRVSAETFRRVACDCGIVAVGRDGEALNIGRRTRSIPPAIRRALMLRDHGCAFPGCTHTRFLHAHHIEHWLHGGETSVSNLVMLCTFHHRQLHEGGWSITAAAGGTFSFNSPSGWQLSPEPARVCVENGDAWLRKWAEDRGVALGPDINRPRWDGKQPDYGLAVECLVDAR